MPKVENMMTEYWRKVENRASNIISKHGKYHGAANRGRNYSVTYNGRTLYSDCTGELAEKLAYEIVREDAE